MQKVLRSEIVTEDGRTLTADLFIDASGFKKILIEKVMKSEFISFNDVLMNDSAIGDDAVVDGAGVIIRSTDGNKSLTWENETRGSGYVYSSKFVNKDQAEKEFRSHLSLRLGNEKANDIDLKHIDIRHGVQKEPWIKNVCAIGLALGFIEPLESTGLLTTHENIIRLEATLSKRNGYVNQFDIDGWNFAAREELEGFKQFVSMHYALSQREDTPYWKHVTNNVQYAPKIYDLETEFRNNASDTMYRLNTSNELNQETASGETFILTGMGLSPISKSDADLACYRFKGAKQEMEKARNLYINQRDSILKYIETLPTHYEFLKKGIYHNET